MFDLNIRFQIAAMIIFIVVVYDYKKQKVLPLLSNRCFSFMMVLTGINLLLDIACVYMITHVATYDEVLIRMCHQLYIITLEVLMLGLFYYVESLASDQKRIGKVGLALSLIPFLATLVVVMFGRIEFVHRDMYIYSTGVMKTALYLSIAFYVTYALIETFRHRITKRDERSGAIRIGIAIWLIAAVIQIFIPEWQLSSLAAVTMLLFIYLSIENPKEHVDPETGLMNQRAFSLVASEKIDSHKNVTFVTIVIEDIARIRNLFDHKTAAEIMAEIGEYQNNIFSSKVYRVGDNYLTAIINEDEESVNTQVQVIEKLLCTPWKVTRGYVPVEAHIDIIDKNIYGRNISDLLSTIEYMAKRTKDEEEDNYILRLDEEIVSAKDRETTIEGLLRDAIVNDGFEVYYQPIYKVKTGKFVSAEAFVRLKDNVTLGFVSPEEFIPIAENKDMIMEIGRIVFDKVCRFAIDAQLIKKGIEYIEINLSGVQCRDSELVGQLKQIIQAYDIPASFINLEITESASEDINGTLKQNLKALRELGCNISMDDFGTGNSNFSKMTETTYDLIKVDKSIIWPCFEQDSKKARIILEGIVGMLAKLDISVVAEGVETKEMVEQLSKMNFDYLQGYYFSRPLVADEYIIFLGKNV